MIDLTDNQVGATLCERDALLSSTGALGPPDLCYLVYKRSQSFFTKLFSKSPEEARFHYIIGNNTSSIGTIAAYFHKFVTFQDSALSSGIYCIFDLFSNNDIRVEISIPGTVLSYCVTQTRARQEATQETMDGAYVSSILRYFYCEENAPCTVVNPFNSVSDVKLFVETACRFREKVGCPMGDIRDTRTFSQHVLFHALSKYLVGKRLFRMHSIYFSKLASIDPLMLTLLAEAAVVSHHSQKELISLISSRLERTQSLQLELALGKLYFASFQLEAAEAVFRSLIERNCENFAYWEHLIGIYIVNRQFSEVLCCMSCAPTFNKPNTPLTEQVNSPFSPPVSAFSTARAWAKPRYYDFRAFTQTEVSGRQNEQDVKTSLFRLEAPNYAHNEKRLYKFLIQVLLYKDWRYITETRGKLFSNVSAELELEECSLLNITGHSRKITDTAFIERFHKRNSSISLEPLEQLSKPATAGAEDFEEPRVLLNSGLFDPNYAESHSHASLSDLFSSPHQEESPLLSSLVHSLYEDLKQLIGWQKESSDRDGVEKDAITFLPYSGEIWLMRGYLAERLRKERIAERAYRYSVDKGFSVFVWYRLMKLYTATCNPKAVLICIIEVLKHLTNEGILFSSVLPEWMEQVLCRICSGCGFRQLFATAVELKCERFPALVGTLARIQAWKVDGVEEAEY